MKLSSYILAFVGSVSFFLAEISVLNAEQLIVAQQTNTVNVSGGKALNKVPVAKSIAVETVESKFIDIVLGHSDDTSGVISYHLNSRTVNGTLKGRPPNKRYTPNPGFVGIDSFVYKIFDGSSYSAPVKVTINVKKSTNAIPVAQVLNLETLEDTLIDFKLLGNDSDHSPREISYHLDSRPLHGSLKGTPPNKRYIPDAGYSGPDSFFYKVFDGDSYSKSVKVTINVKKSTNAKPVANALSLNTLKDIAFFDFQLAGSDADNAPRALTYHLDSRPSHGSLKGAPPNKRYIPDAGYSGEDSFFYKVFDGESYSKPVKVTINIEASTNAKPVATALEFFTVKDIKYFDFTLLGSDSDNAPRALTYHLDSRPSHGSLKGTPPNKRYIPDVGFTGKEEFIYKVFDGESYSKPVTVTINVEGSGTRPDNSGPIAKSSSVTGQSNKSLTINMIATDPDGDELTYLISERPKKGSLSSVSGNKVVYTPEAGFSGDDSFRFRVGDGRSEPSRDATVSIKVIFSNQAPTATSFTKATKLNKSVIISLIGIDPDEDPLTYLIGESPKKGSLSSVSGNKVTYTPNSGFIGNDSFTYKVSDSEKTSALATVSLLVGATNQVPVAKSFTLTSFVNTAVGVSLNGTDDDGDDLSYEITSSPSKGSLGSLSGNKLTYTPNSGFIGNDSFKYKVYDGTAYSSVAEIKIKVVGKTKVDLYSASVVSETPLPFDKLDVVVSDTHVFIASGNNGINIFSKINSAKPIKIKNLWVSGEVRMLKLSSDKKTLFVASPFYGLNIINVSDPAKAHRIGGVESFGSTAGIALSSDNRYVYLADDTHVVVVDVANLSKPKIIGNIQLASGSAKAVALTPDNKYLLVASGAAGLHIVDISKPSQPSIVSRINTKGGEAQDVVSSLNGKVAYVADGFSGVSIVNINNPLNPTRITTWNTKRPAHDIIDLNAKTLGLLSDGVTLLVGMGSGGIYGIEVDNPAKPVQVGSIDTATLVFNFDISPDETKLYGLDFYDGLMVYDIAK